MANNITDFIGGGYKEMLGRALSQEELDKLYYETHDCLSDDSDLEMARIDRWAEDNGIEVI